MSMGIAVLVALTTIAIVFVVVVWAERGSLDFHIHKWSAWSEAKEDDGWSSKQDRKCETCNMIQRRSLHG